jgi:hypothetical protein
LTEFCSLIPGLDVKLFTIILAGPMRGVVGLLKHLYSAGAQDLAIICDDALSLLPISMPVEIGSADHSAKRLSEDRKRRRISKDHSAFVILGIDCICGAFANASQHVQSLVKLPFRLFAGSGNRDRTYVRK